jgi:SulP family sulfate permease
MLFMYGSLFFAAADVFEKTLPKPGDAHRAAVVLGMRGRPEIGSTVLEVFRRYAKALAVNENILILAGVDLSLREQLERTGMLEVLGAENIIPSTDVIGEAMNAAVLRGREWTRGPLAADGGRQTEDGPPQE